MKNFYKKPSGFTVKDATRKELRGYTARNRAEDQRRPIEDELALIRKQKRARLVAENPAMSDIEIDTMVDRVMTGGNKKTSEIVQPARGIPRDVAASRRAERRREVKNRAQSRRS